MRHIVWDWNGTLFDDTLAVVAATNDALAPYGVGELTVDRWRELYSHPVWACYERVLGRRLRDGEWERIDGAFHRAYGRHMTRCDLAAYAAETLARWRSAGRTQSLLSMWWHDELLPCVERLGVRPAFVRVDGLRRPDGAGGPKAEHLVRHLAAIGIDPSEVTVVGDSVDDAVAAEHVGARAVLYTGGTHSRRALQAVGVPVVDSLADAVHHAM
ncbi:MAG: HAD hydrolase-like protein [Streptosporangiales bacterium]|nr:HAD hydrolase-like protein [Streptosporangiales bacterium]